MSLWVSTQKSRTKYAVCAAVAVFGSMLCAGSMANTLFTSVPQTLTETVPNFDNEYGYSVAISADGTRAVVGVPFASVIIRANTYADAGKVYVLGYNSSGNNDGAWTLIKELDDPAPNSTNPDYFGHAVAISPDGHTVLIGAYGAALTSTTQFAGKAYLYSDTSGTWQVTQELDDDPSGGGGPLPNDEFGYAVSLGGSGSNLVALIGAPGTTVVCTQVSNCSSTAGAVYIYDVIAGAAAPASPAEFQDPDALATVSNGADNGYQFGVAVALSADGGSALFGAPHAAIATTADAGKTYLSALVSGTWGNLLEVDDPAAVSGDHFGSALALSGNGTLALVGTPDAASKTGAAYLYAWNGTALSAPTGIIEPGTGQVAGDRFAAALGFSGNSSLAVIGSPGTSVTDTTSTFTSTTAGKAYVYSVGNWSAPAYVLADPSALSATSNGAADGDVFGSAVALSAVNGTAFIGVPDATVNVGGTAYVVAGQADMYFNPVDLSLSLTTSVDPSPAPLSGQFSYLFTVTSQGSLMVNGASLTQTTDATNIILTDVLPAGVSYVSAASAGDNCSLNGSIVTCMLASLAPGGVWQPGITVATGSSPSEVTNQSASVTADQLETNSADSSASVSTIVDDAPVAVSNVATSPIPVHVSASESLPVTQAYSNQPITYSLMSNPAHGAIVLDAASGTYTYTAASGYGDIAGGQPDSFTFTVNDGYLTSNTANVYLQVYAAPSVVDSTLTAHVAASGTLSATDPDTSQSLVYSILIQPAHGSVSLNSSTGNFSYTSSEGYTGSDKFAFNAKDSFNTSNTATENITVFTAPVASNGSYSNSENTVIHGQLMANDPDSSQTLTYSIVKQPAHGSLILNSATGAFTYGPDSGYVGSDSFTFSARDTYNVSNVATTAISLVASPSSPIVSSSSTSGGGDLGWLSLLLLAGIVGVGRRRR